MVASLTQIRSPREAYEFVIERDRNDDLSLSVKEVDPQIVVRYDSQTEGIPGQLEIWEVMTAASSLSPFSVGIDPYLVQQEKEAGRRWNEITHAMREMSGPSSSEEASWAVRDYLGKGRTFGQAVTMVDSFLQFLPVEVGETERSWALLHAFDAWNEIVTTGGDPDWYVGLVRALTQGQRDRPSLFNSVENLWRGLREYGGAPEAEAFIDIVVANDSQLLSSADRAFAASLVSFNDGHLGPYCKDLRPFTEAEKRHFTFATPLMMVHPNGESFIDYVLPKLVQYGYSDAEIRLIFQFYGDDKRNFNCLAEAVERLVLNGFSKSEQMQIFTTVAGRVEKEKRSEVINSITWTSGGYAKLRGPNSDPLDLMFWCLDRGRERPAETVAVAGRLAESGLSMFDIQHNIYLLIP